MNADERKKYRRENYRAEIQRRDNAEFTVVSLGTDGKPDISRFLTALESIRRIVYPELSREIKMDRTVVTIIRKM